LKRNIAALVLAAGSSTRMGSAKQLLQLGDSTLLRHSVQQARASNVTRTIVVLGAEADGARGELTDVATIENPRWSEGIGTSISAGVAAAMECDAVVILVCDQPHVSTALINRLIDEHTVSRKPIVASRYSDTVGVPALFAREFFDALQQLAPDEGAKRLLHQHRESVAAVDFPKGAIDLDTPQDYERFLTS